MCLFEFSATDQVESAKYLGIHFRPGKYFRLSTKESKGSFYRAVTVKSRI